MITGICTLPLIPLRLESSERSEMISQILFGELVEVIEENESWCRVRLFSDNYTGWCTSKMVLKLPETIFDKLQNSIPILTQDCLTSCIKVGFTNQKLFLPAGSRLFFLNPMKGTFPVFKRTQKNKVEIDEEMWSIIPTYATSHSYSIGKSKGDEIIRIASLFMNAPYLWGGKSILGMDCSGLVQVVFSIFGLFLPRDASEQALYGEHIPDLSLSLAGDLAFFANPEGQVVHVGLLMAGDTIIHSSGCVHVDRMDQTGIYSDTLGRYTHYLHSIKRIIFA